MAKSKEYENEISVLKDEMTEYDKIEENIQKHLNKVILLLHKAVFPHYLFNFLKNFKIF